MTSYLYRARDRYGVLSTGQMEADSDKAVAVNLEKSGLTPISITPAETGGLSTNLDQVFSFLQRVRPEEMIVFTRQLTSILEAGIPLTSGLEAVSEQIRNRYFRQVVTQIKKEIEGGATFSDALEMHKKVFSPLVINMVRAGEKAGILPQVLDRISSLIEYDQRTSDQIKSATRYPLIVLVVIVGAILVLNVYVIPRFAEFFASFKMDLPLPTKILMGVNFVIMHYWYIILGTVIIVTYAVKRVLDTEAGRYNWDRFILSTPIFGPLFNKIYLSRFGRMLAAMLGSGIPILEALTITAATVENKVVSRVTLDVRDEVFQGKSLAEPMKKSGVFPPIAVSMVAIGEKVGMLEGMLNKMADYFDREVDYTIKNLTPLIEPLMIFFLALIMLVLALGIFLPMWNVVGIYKSM